MTIIFSKSQLYRNSVGLDEGLYPRVISAIRESGMIYKILRKVVREAWDSISVKQLNELIDLMHQRCQDVIDAEGKHTK